MAKFKRDVLSLERTDGDTELKQILDRIGPDNVAEIRVLFLHWSQITDAGLEDLKGRHFPKLRHISRDDTEITNERNVTYATIGKCVWTPVVTILHYPYGSVYGHLLTILHCN